MGLTLTIAEAEGNIPQSILQIAGMYARQAAVLASEYAPIRLHLTRIEDTGIPTREWLLLCNYAARVDTFLRWVEQYPQDYQDLYLAILLDVIGGKWSAERKES